MDPTTNAISSISSDADDNIGIVIDSAVDQQQQQQQLLNQNFNMDPTAMPMTSDVSSSTSLDQLTNTWTCHLHISSSSAECTMRLIGDTYYHIVPVKTISRDAQQYNTKNIPNEYWEWFDTNLYVSPIAYTSHINSFLFFQRIMSIFQQLDMVRLKYSSQNSAADFVKRHLVCTPNGLRITLSNKNLLKSGSSAASMLAAANGNGKPYSFYTRHTWIKSLLKALFPRIEIVKNGVAPSIPVWAINMYFTSNNGDSIQPKSKRQKIV